MQLFKQLQKLSARNIAALKCERRKTKFWVPWYPLMQLSVNKYHNNKLNSMLEKVQIVHVAWPKCADSNQTIAWCFYFNSCLGFINANDSTILSGIDTKCSEFLVQLQLFRRCAQVLFLCLYYIIHICASYQFESSRNKVHICAKCSKCKVTGWCHS